jgi:hypothetical protein
MKTLIFDDFRTQETLGPDIVYVQQAQATLDALHALGVTDIIENW